MGGGERESNQLSDSDGLLRNRSLERRVAVRRMSLVGASAL